jgi:VWFA-related protein
MARVIANRQWQSRVGRWPALAASLGLAVVLSLATPAVQAQSSGSASQAQPQAQAQSAQDIPDAPSTVQPPPPKPALPEIPSDTGNSSSSTQIPRDASAQPDQEKQPPPPMPPIQTVQPGSTPRNQINPTEDLYKIVKYVNFVQIPVTVKDADGRRVDGLLPTDFTVLENGKKQTLTFFTNDPFQLSVAILLDVGMPDVAVQKVNQTYSALAGAFSRYDEVALYTYSSTVSQVSDFSESNQRLSAELNQMKLVRGHNAGPPVLGGPLGPGGPTVNGAPVGGPTIAPVNTPDREAHVLNDAILRAALDLSKRPRTRRKVIFVISDGRELGSKAGYRDVLRVLETHDIEVKAVVVDSGALPVFRQIEKIHLPQHGSKVPFIRGQGYSDILPKYASATGGGQVFPELSRNAVEEAYAEITSEARNQYTLGYTPQATTSTSPYRSVEVLVHKKGLKISAMAGYYSIPPTPAR